MHNIELLQANNNNYKIKFISILKHTSIFDTKTLSSFYDDLLNYKKVTIEFKEIDLNALNDIAMELAELEIGIGEASFHEDDSFSFEE